MSEFIIDGYHFAGGKWHKIQEFNLLLPENENKALNQIFHNTNRAFYYHKIGNQWFRATVSESKTLIWTHLKQGGCPFWAILPTSNPYQTALSEISDAANTALRMAKEEMIPEKKEKEEADYPGTLSPGYQTIIRTTLSHNLNQPEEVTADQWQMILKTCLYPANSRANLDQIRSDSKLLHAYQGIARFLMIENINQYTYEIDASQPTIGEIYAYTAWLIFQNLNNKEGLEPPTLTDKSVLSKKVGEVKEKDIVNYRGFDYGQELILNSLRLLFHGTINDLKELTQLYSLDELIELNALFKAVRRSLPLTDREAVIWDEFVIIVTEGNYTLEQFYDKLQVFKSQNRESVLKELINSLRAKIESVSQLTNPDALRAELTRDGSPAIMRSLGEEKAKDLWKILPHRTDNKLDTTEKILPIQDKLLFTFYLGCEDSLWNQMAREPGAVELIQAVYHRKTPLSSAIEYLHLLPSHESRKEVLIQSSEKFPNKVDFITAIRAPMERAQLDEVFEEILIDNRIIGEFNHYDFWKLIRQTLTSRQRVRMLSSASAFRTAIKKSYDIIVITKNLHAADQLKFLALTQTINHFDSHPIGLFEVLKPSAKKDVHLLAKYIHSTTDLIEVASRYSSNIDKVFLVQCWCLAKPERFITEFMTTLKKLSLTDFLLRLTKPEDFRLLFSQCRDQEERNDLSIGYALLHSAHESNDFTVEEIPLEYRKCFIFSQSIQEYCNKDRIYLIKFFSLIKKAEELTEAESQKIESLIIQLDDLALFIDHYRANSFVDLMSRTQSLIKRTLASAKGSGDPECRINCAHQYVNFIYALRDPQFLEALDTPRVGILLTLTHELKELGGNSQKLLEPMIDMLRQRSKKHDLEKVDDSAPKRMKMEK